MEARGVVGSVVESDSAESDEGVTTGGVGVENLGEEGPEGDDGREQAFAERDGFVGDRLLDLFVAEDVGEGVGEGKLELVATGRRRFDKCNDGILAGDRWGSESNDLLASCQLTRPQTIKRLPA